MKARVVLLLVALMSASLFACAKQVGNGGACFQSSECHSGSICAATVYGNFCMKECDPSIVRCDDEESCLQSSDIGFGGAGGAGGEGGAGGVGGGSGMGGAGATGGAAGMGGSAGGGGNAGAGGAAGSAGMAGSGGMGGAAGAGGQGGVGGRGGVGGQAGAGGAPDEEIWVCLPGAGNIQNSEIIPRVTGQICDYSIECVVAHVCVCVPGTSCSDENRNGLTCQWLCDPAEINQCPGIAGIQPACTDLGDGRGFCDPSTIQGN